MSLQLLVLAGGLVLAPAQAGKLEITNIRPTFGEFGPTRPDWKLPLADAVHVVFDIQGLTAEPSGRVRFRTHLEVENSKGERIYKPEPLETEVVNIQGGDRVRHALVMLTGLDQAPGTYRIKTTVHDLLAKDGAKREAAFTQDFTLLPADFGVVRFQMTYDRLGQQPAPCAGVVGQTLFATGVVVGYKRDASNENQASFQIEMTLLDPNDRPTATRPARYIANAVPASVNNVPVRFDLPLHRAGQYRILLKATDHVAKKTTTLTVPFQVLEPK